MDNREREYGKSCVELTRMPAAEETGINNSRTRLPDEARAESPQTKMTKHLCCEVGPWLPVSGGISVDIYRPIHCSRCLVSGKMINYT
jgi:hypothetical protein